MFPEKNFSESGDEKYKCSKLSKTFSLNSSILRHETKSSSYILEKILLEKRSKGLKSE